MITARDRSNTCGVVVELKNKLFVYVSFGRELCGITHTVNNVEAGVFGYE